MHAASSLVDDNAAADSLRVGRVNVVGSAHHIVIDHLCSAPNLDSELIHAAASADLAATR